METPPSSVRSGWLALSIVIGPLYYFSLHLGFHQAMAQVLDLTANHNDGLTLAWDNHWIYRIAAECGSIFFAVFVAARIFPAREKLAAIFAGIGISAVYIAELSILAWAVKNSTGPISIKEPWYQFTIDGLVILASPFLAILISEIAADLNKSSSEGLLSFSRWHFLWLWVPAYFYAAGLLSPIAHFYSSQMEGGLFSSLVGVVVFGIAAAPLLIVGRIGLALLSKQLDLNLGRTAQNFAGITTLTVGWVIGFSLQFLWYRLVGAIYRLL